MKILLVLYNLSVNGGVANCIMQYYDSLIESSNQVDFLLVDDEVSEKFNKQIHDSEIYYLPKSKLKYTPKTIVKVLSVLKNHYDVIHINIPAPYGSLILGCASLARVPLRVYHSHSPVGSPHSIKGYLFKYLNKLCEHRSNCRLACSNLTGETSFSKKNYDILPNCIDVKSFIFNPLSREKIRKQINCSDNSILIGCVARVDYLKNPFFIIDCINELRKIDSKYKFVWVGDGNMMQEVKDYIGISNLNDSIDLVGAQSNVSEWYSAMDCMLLPSRKEGLGISFIEAQASGLTCFGSTNVPSDTEVTDLMHRLDLSIGEKAWAEYIDNKLTQVDRKKYNEILLQSQFNIDISKNKLLDIYHKKINLCRSKY